MPRSILPARHEISKLRRLRIARTSIGRVSQNAPKSNSICSPTSNSVRASTDKPHGQVSGNPPAFEQNQSPTWSLKHCFLLGTLAVFSRRSRASLSQKNKILVVISNISLILVHFRMGEHRKCPRFFEDWRGFCSRWGVSTH